MTPEYTGLSWEELRGRLSEALEHSSNGEDRKESMERILRERAEQFRGDASEMTERDDSAEIMYFVVRGQRIGVEWSNVLEVMPVRSIMALPRSCEPLLGVCQLRGVLYPVMTLTHVLQAGEKSTQGDRHIILISGGENVFGIAVEEIVGLCPSGNREIAFTAGRAQERSWIHHLDGDRTPILNIVALYDDLQRADRAHAWKPLAATKIQEN